MSEDAIYAGLASGVAGLFNYYAGINDTGKFFQQLTDYVANNSAVEFFTPQSSITNETSQYSSLYGTGTDTQNLINWALGGSQEQLFASLATGISEIIKNFAARTTLGLCRRRSLMLLPEAPSAIPALRP